MSNSVLPIRTLDINGIDLPAAVDRLYDIAHNVWWTWHPEASLLFHHIAPDSWAMYRNPVQLLINADRDGWEPLLKSDEFLSLYTSLVADFDRYMEAKDTWFSRERPQGLPGPVAYFSMEFGLHQSLPIYSGGLGILSGDHCKSASDLGLPFVAVGLLYHRGYFRQTIDADGFQQHYYPEHDFSRLGARPAATRTGREVVISVPFPERQVHARIWVLQVGRIPLLLLDTDLAANHPADRPITNVLYTRGREMRLAQELVLGVGGVKALDALGIQPAAWHINEGHSAFLQFERAQRLVETGSGWPEAFGAIRRNTVFTTHTPVPAGNEQFDSGLVLRYLAPWTGDGLEPEGLLRMGNADGDGPSEQFNLTALGIRTAAFVNGVSQLNGAVLNSMWSHLFPPDESGASPIVGITNGVHTATWMGPEMGRLLDRHLGDWRQSILGSEEWSEVEGIADTEVWNAHQAQKARLGRFLRARLREQFARHGRAPGELRQVDHLFRPEILTIGFARRFATYKRAALLFRDMERLRHLFDNSHQRLQVVFAGKAHPADREGQNLIRDIFHLSQSDTLRGRVFFIEDYDMRVARMMLQGVDIWLNTPRRPLEASGTSGMKAAINGALNLSIPDGWWPEAADGVNGWTIGDGSTAHSEEEQDRVDAEALYGLLEREILPAYYALDEHGLPRDWLRRMKRSIATVAPAFSSGRMVEEYATEYLRLGGAE